MFCITGHLKDTLCEDYMTNRTLHRSAGTTRKAPVHLGEQTEKVLSTLVSRAANNFTILLGLFAAFALKN